MLFLFFPMLVRNAIDFFDCVPHMGAIPSDVDYSAPLKPHERRESRAGVAAVSSTLNENQSIAQPRDLSDTQRAKLMYTHRIFRHVQCGEGKYNDWWWVAMCFVFVAVAAPFGTTTYLCRAYKPKPGSYTRERWESYAAGRSASTRKTEGFFAHANEMLLAKI